MTSCMDEIEFRSDGTEVYMRMTRVRILQPEGDHGWDTQEIKQMLRITVRERASEQRWILQG
jgi:hypothetical protein